ncbi:uncharacterized protein LOC127724660 [Mytilus californianus]|uniref:uncharacterized protein LOC127724660 n=1 Tax=Mytilus californianus TaxID=6549 RepID=UPI0022459C0D|nr:uncharacterized protein LOC127724660 [Mytilus californianus]
MIVPVSISLTRQVDIHIFSDASEQAISAVAYLEAIDETGSAFIGFLTGKSKLAPIKGHTIPRLELCGAVLATEVGEAICHHMNRSPSVCHYYTDSRVVLGYICNTTRRFFTYVSNRVEKIHKVSEPSQWSYVSTDRNPADLGTRFISSPDMQVISSWINGPNWLLNKEPFDMVSFPLLSPQDDKEIRSEIVSRKTQIDSLQIDSQRFSKFSSWRSLVRSLSLLRHIAKTLSSAPTSRCKGWHICAEKDTPEFIKGTETLIIRQVQKEFFEHEIDSLNTDQNVPKNSAILKLDPILDAHGILRVGGRLNRSTLTLGEKNPILIPGKHHIARLLVLHYHDKVHHQGRHITEGAIRTAGYWITGLKRLIYSIVSSCILCLRFRGTFSSQKMADLPEERLLACPPFTYVGVDCFGPWNIVTRRTRGGSANSKRWAVLFVCFSCRAIMNARPLVPISSDPNSPFILSPNTLLTQKVSENIEDFSHLNTHDVYTNQWKFVQVLADKFWTRWRQEYLQSLQTRRKWQHIKQNIQVGDLVLLKDNELHRNNWPIGLVERVFPGRDNLIRKVQLRVVRDKQHRVYVRPISQIVLLCHS